MEYNRNLSGHFTKPKKNLIFGLLLLAIAIWFIFDAFSGPKVKYFYAFYALVLILNAAHGIARSRGVLLWTKAYVKIDEEALIIKTISKEKKALWGNVERIDLSDKKIAISPADNKFQWVSLKSFEDEMIDEIMEHIAQAATLKGITVTR